MLQHWDDREKGSGEAIRAYLEGRTGRPAPTRADALAWIVATLAGLAHAWLLLDL